MQILITVAMAAVAAMQTPASAAPTTRSAPLLVRSVIDGNTIDVVSVGRIRLLGIDAPASAAALRRQRRSDARRGIACRSWSCVGGCVSSRRAAASTLTASSRLRAHRRRPVRQRRARAGGPGAGIGTRAVVASSRTQRAEADARMFRRNLWGSAPPLPATGYTRPSSVNRPPTSRTKTPASKRRKTRKRKS